MAGECARVPPCVSSPSLRHSPFPVQLLCPPRTVRVRRAYGYASPPISYNTFASAGSDGTVSIWDHKSKKRLRQYPKYAAPVPSIAFSCDGTKLAVGVSYTWEEGEEGARTAERPTVFIKNVGEEVKVRY